MAEDQCGNISRSDALDEWNVSSERGLMTQSASDRKLEGLDIREI